MLHPRIKMPLWAAVALAAAAYVARAFVRGWDFRPDLPLDILIGAAFGALIVLTAIARRSASADDGDDGLSGEMDAEDGESGESGK